MDGPRLTPWVRDEMYDYAWFNKNGEKIGVGPHPELDIPTPEDDFPIVLAVNDCTSVPQQPIPIVEIEIDINKEMTRKLAEGAIPIPPICWECVADLEPVFPLPISSKKSKFNFEEGLMGWIAQDYKDSRACVQVLHSNEKAKEGQYSLKMRMDLVGGDANKSKGEAWVNMKDTPPNGVTIPVNLANRKVTAWVYAPSGSRGDRNYPNGFQLFVKDTNWKSQYGSWSNVVEDQWVKIELQVSTTEPLDGWIDDGFNPRRIIAVGVKMGSGGGSRTSFKGDVYIDEINW